jgi:hypothetical protein
MRLLVASLVLTAILAPSVRAGEVPARPPVSDTRSANGAALYVSPFASYRRFTEQPTANWSEVNDRVRTIGGWQAYARESQGEAPPNANATKAAAEAKSPTAVEAKSRAPVEPKAPTPAGTRAPASPDTKSPAEANGQADKPSSPKTPSASVPRGHSTH